MEVIYTACWVLGSVPVDVLEKRVETPSNPTRWRDDARDVGFSTESTSTRRSTLVPPSPSSSGVVTIPFSANSFDSPSSASSPIPQPLNSLLHLLRTPLKSRPRNLHIKCDFPLCNPPRL